MCVCICIALAGVECPRTVHLVLEGSPLSSMVVVLVTSMVFRNRWSSHRGDCLHCELPHRLSRGCRHWVDDRLRVLTSSAALLLLLHQVLLVIVSVIIAIIFVSLIILRLLLLQLLLLLLLQLLLLMLLWCGRSGTGHSCCMGMTAAAVCPQVFQLPAQAAILSAQSSLLVVQGLQLRLHSVISCIFFLNLLIQATGCRSPGIIILLMLLKR
mmetsp:Transcript_10787/g.24645  ORF Transcript_10787/g.24645 Transcript_10787/m.24645 type:complete len:212 (+) Transcript_10787:578-1213(+)